jgi:hypothetical protein
VFLALKLKESPKIPVFTNWKEYAEDFPNIPPVKDPMVETWWDPNGSYQRCQESPIDISPKEKNIGEKKLEKARLKAAEKAIQTNF